ncbi:MAG TPA: hypothetical protein PK971_16380, partial [Saprospiraceae bacterium]|nr:hypothetical protein [Saprospiraceae bacterium]
ERFGARVTLYHAVEQVDHWMDLLKRWSPSQGWLYALLSGVLLTSLYFMYRYSRATQAPPAVPASRPAPPTQTPRTPAPAPAPRIPPPTPAPHLANARTWVHKPEAERQFYHAIYHALLDRLMQRWQISPSHLDRAHIRQELAHRRVPEARIEALLGAWQTAEEVLFAGQSAPERMADTLRQAEAALAD